MLPIISSLTLPRVTMVGYLTGMVSANHPVPLQLEQVVKSTHLARELHVRLAHGLPRPVDVKTSPPPNSPP